MQPSASAQNAAQTISQSAGQFTGSSSQLEFNSIVGQAEAATFLRDEAGINNVAEQSRIINSFGADIKVGTYAGQAYQYSATGTSYSQYLTPNAVSDPIQQLALPPGNPASVILQYNVDPTRAILGTASPQEFVDGIPLSGGAQQIWIPTRNVLTPTRLLGP